MGLYHCMGLYFDYSALYAYLRRLCCGPCWRTQNKPSPTPHNDPVAFLRAATRAKTSVRRISTRIESEESLDGRSDISTKSGHSTKKISDKDSWKQRAKTWKKKSKKHFKRKENQNDSPEELNHEWKRRSTKGSSNKDNRSSYEEENNGNLKTKNRLKESVECLIEEEPNSWKRKSRKYKSNETTDNPFENSGESSSHLKETEEKEPHYWTRISRKDKVKRTLDTHFDSAGDYSSSKFNSDKYSSHDCLNTENSDEGDTTQCDNERPKTPSQISLEKTSYSGESYDFNHPPRREELSTCREVPENEMISHPNIHKSFSLARLENNSLKMTKPLAEVRPMPKIEQVHEPIINKKGSPMTRSKFPLITEIGIGRERSRSGSLEKLRATLSSIVKPTPSTPKLKSRTIFYDQNEAGNEHNDNKQQKEQQQRPNQRQHPFLKVSPNINRSGMCLDHGSDSEEEDDKQSFQDSVKSVNTNTEGLKIRQQLTDINEDRISISECEVTAVITTPSNPANECFGTATVALHGVDAKLINVGIVELRGLPWVGGVNGLMLEIGVAPGGRTQWIALPHALGPNVGINLKVTVKVPKTARSETQSKSSIRSGHKHRHSISSTNQDDDDPDGGLTAVRLSVWGCGRVWRNCAIGHALVPLSMVKQNNPRPVTIGLHHNLQVSKDLGVLELGLSCVYELSEATLTIQILRSQRLRPPIQSYLAPIARAARRTDRQDVWCRVSLLVEGERTHRILTPRVTLPVTCDPVFRATTSFTVARDTLPNTCIIVKVIAARSVTEEVLGRVILGPLLYLGAPTDSTHPPPITLSHWGRALNYGSHTVWHRLYK